MAAESLREELLGIPGVEAAEFDGNSATPEGVKVRLAAGVDVEVVGEEIQRVLTQHGLRSELAGKRGGPGPEVSAGVATAVLDEDEPLPIEPPTEPALPPDIEEPVAPESMAPEPVAPEPVAPESMAPEPVAPEPVAPEPIIILDSVDRPSPPTEPATPSVSTDHPTLEAVAVEEGRSGVLVRARNEAGAEAVRRSSATGRGLDEAVVAAIAELHGSASLPMIVSLVEQDIDGTRIITVVLELGRGSRAVGSAVFDGGRAYAVGRAAWAALSSV